MTSEEDEIKLAHCPALVTLKVISGKWKTRILWLLRDGSMQFGQLKNSLKGISAKMLTEHLRQLETAGIIDNIRDESNQITTSSYAYTEYGRSLVPVLDCIGEWGLIHETKLSADDQR